MSVDITYFVHGTTTDNERNLATGHAPGELSELGIQQARELGGLVSEEVFDVIISSDLKRAVDTAELAFGQKYTLLQDARLRECDYGDLTEQTHTFKDDMNQFIEQPFPNGESYTDVEHRLADLLNEVKEKYDGKHVAFVAHQAPQLALDVLLKGKTWEQAISEDWRHTKSWQPGWKYVLD